MTQDEGRFGRVNIPKASWAPLGMRPNVPKQILIHCKHGADRTGLIVALYRIVFEGWDKISAIEELKNGGYGFHSIFINIPEYIEDIDIEQLKNSIM